jgi:sigma-B regulation protein RsbU (phosphoserine phosphatase)
MQKKLIKFMALFHRHNTLRDKILFPVLSSSILETLAFIILFVISILWMQAIAADGYKDMGQASSQISTAALMTQVATNITRHAEDMGGLIDEQLTEIQNNIIAISSITTDIYNHPGNYIPRGIRVLKNGEQIDGQRESYVYYTPGINPADVQNEVRRMANIDKVIETIYHINSDITASYIAGESGFFLFVRTDHSTLLDYDARDRQWYKDTKKNNTLYWSDIYADSSGRGPTITCAAPFYDESDGKKILKGVAGIGVLLVNFSEIINAAAPDKGTIVFLLDRDGTKLFSSDGSGIKIENDVLVGENYKKSENPDLKLLAEKMTAREKGIIKITVGNKPSYVAYNPLSTLDWSLGVIVDQDVITSASSTMDMKIGELAAKTTDKTNQVIFFMVFALLFGSFCAIVFRTYFSIAISKKIAGPISYLASQVRQLNGTSSDKEIIVPAATIEIQQLSNAFNAMTARLYNYAKTLARSVAEHERLSAELDISRRIQTDMLSYDFPPYPDRPYEFDLYAEMHAAKAVGGDFYDFFFIDTNRFALIIADVSGKGVPAALFMTISKTLLKNHLKDGLTPEAAVGKLNRQLAYNNNESMFVTMWVGVFNPTNGKLEYVNAGHNPPLLKSGADGFKFLYSNFIDLVVGVMEDTIYHKHEITLSRGDELFLYTDGVPEAFNKSQEMYGESRLREFVDLHYHLPIKIILEKLYTDINKFSAGIEQSDDITMIMFRYREKESPQNIPELPVISG